jgi:hypothetical protein
VLAVALQPLQRADPRRGGDGAGPERLGGGVALGDGDLPATGVQGENLAQGLGADAAPAMFPRYPELAHVALHHAAAMRVGVGQREARRLATRADEERPAVWLRPVSVHVGIGRQPPLGVERELA